MKTRCVTLVLQFQKDGVDVNEVAPVLRELLFSAPADQVPYVEEVLVLSGAALDAVATPVAAREDD